MCNLTHGIKWSKRVGTYKMDRDMRKVHDYYLRSAYLSLLYGVAGKIFLSQYTINDVCMSYKLRWCQVKGLKREVVIVDVTLALDAICNLPFTVFFWLTCRANTAVLVWS